MAWILNLSFVPRLRPKWAKLGQIFGSLLFPEFTMDFSETYTLYQWNHGHRPSNLRGQNWEIRSLFPGYVQVWTNLWIATPPWVYNGSFWIFYHWASGYSPSLTLRRNFAFVLCSPATSNFCPNWDKSLNRYFSLSFQWIFLKLISMKLWV